MAFFKSKHKQAAKSATSQELNFRRIKADKALHSAALAGDIPEMKVRMARFENALYASLYKDFLNGKKSRKDAAKQNKRRKHENLRNLKRGKEFE